MERSTQRACGSQTTNRWVRNGVTLVALFAFIPAARCVGQTESGVAADGSLSAEPYIVYVAQEEAFARCGPSGEFYRTDALRHGQELEVYVETADGWLGVRPPENSFCWVPASTLKLSGSSDQAVVIEDHTVAWIGTHLGRARRYRWQVQLAKDEPVTILGKSERDGPDGPQMWYRIVPPSGEFRWVHRDQIVESTEALVAQSSWDRNDMSETEELLPAPRPQVSAKRDKLARGDSPASQPINSAEPVAAELVQAAAERPIGSGVREDWQANEVRGRAIERIASDAYQSRARESELNRDVESNREPATQNSSLAIVGAARVQPIGAFETMMPANSELASDSNWVGSGTRRAMAEPNPTSPSLLQASATPQQNPIQLVGGFAESSNSVRQSLHVVSAQSISRVEDEARGADAEKLQLMLSRIMAAGASAEEAEPIARSSNALAQTATDPLEARRAQAVVDRTLQYQRIAQRRDGNSIIQGVAAQAIASNETPPVARSLVPAVPPALAAAPLIGASSAAMPFASIPPTLRPTPSTPAAPGDWTAVTGYLVQVYSARPNSPPFALTDNTGRTVAYVTPAPGTNLRMHMNNYIRVEGPRGYVTGMETPHVLVNTATRVAQ